MSKKSLVFSIEVPAAKETVWKILLDKESFKEWTSVFHPDSYMEGNWEEGTEVRFLTPEGDGMISHVTIHKPQEIITMKHEAVISDGKRDTEGEEARRWIGLTETYKVARKGEATQVTIESEISDKYAEWFEQKWIEALDKIRALAESK